VKLNVAWGFWRRKAGCGGIIVIPPGNLRTSKEDEFPNRDSVKWSFDCRRTKEIKDALRMLNHVDDMVEFSG
jgi:hypothetical protein